MSWRDNKELLDKILSDDWDNLRDYLISHAAQHDDTGEQAITSLGTVDFDAQRPKGEPVYNLRNEAYGAYNDDSHASETTTAIETAISDANGGGGGSVFFPVGTYLINSNFTVPSGVDLYFAPGAKIKGDDSGDTVTINGGIMAGAFEIFDNCTIDGTPEVNFINDVWFSGTATDSTSGTTDNTLDFQNDSFKQVKTPVVGSSTITVAASDSNWKDAVNPDYVCDGIAGEFEGDEVTVAAAVTELKSIGGGVIKLLEGTYEFADVVTIDEGDISIVGEGKGTTINIADGKTAFHFDFSSVSPRSDLVSIERLQIDGRGEIGGNTKFISADDTMGIQVTSGHKFTISYVKITGCDICIKFIDTYESVIEHCRLIGGKTNCILVTYDTDYDGRSTGPYIVHNKISSYSVINILASDANSGQADVVIDDTIDADDVYYDETEFASGDTVLILDDNGSEFGVVDSVNTSTETITLTQNLGSTYQTSANAEIRKVTEAVKIVSVTGATVAHNRFEQINSTRGDTESYRHAAHELKLINTLGVRIADNWFGQTYGGNFINIEYDASEPGGTGSPNIDPSRSIAITGNYFAAGTIGNAVESTTKGIVVGDNCYHGTITGNTFYNIDGTAIELGENYWTVAANCIWDIGGSAIDAGTNNVSVNITANQIQKTDRYDNGEQAVYCGVDCKVVGNRIVNTGGGRGIDVRNKCEIVGNTVQTAGLEGIMLRDGHTICIGNKVENSSQDASNTHAGIELFEATYCIVANNICRDTQTGSETQKYGIQEVGDPTPEHNIIKGNILHNNATGAMSLKKNNDDIVEGNIGYLGIGETRTFIKEVEYDDSSPQTIAVEDGYLVTDVWVEVTVTWDGTVSFKVGDGNDDDGFLCDSGGTHNVINLGAAGRYGLEKDQREAYLWDDANGHEKGKEYTSSDTVDITFSSTGSQGKAVVYVKVTRIGD